MLHFALCFVYLQLASVVFPGASLSVACLHPSIKAPVNIKRVEIGCNIPESSWRVVLVHNHLDELDLVGACERRVREQLLHFLLVTHGIRPGFFPLGVVTEELQQFNPVPVLDVVVFPAWH